MALSFPSSPSIGDEFTAGGFTWVWNGTAWSKLAEATSAANDFALLVGSSGDTTYILDRTYTSGRYTIDFVNNDATYDIYAIAEDGTYAGYSNTNVIEITADFTEIVVLGADNGETVLFTYQGTLTSPSSVGDVATAGAFINSVVTSALPDIDDTTVVNGGNFAPDVAVSFIDQSDNEVAAKVVVRNSSTELVATRPDSFSPDDSPYTVKVVNPGIPVPAGTNAHLLLNAVTAGTNPVWQTTGPLEYNVGAATADITLIATDTESSDIDYSIVSGSLPAGLSLDGETGVISGTFTGSASDGDTNTVTFRATDTGGNFLDKALDFIANAAPTWTTTSSDIGDAGVLALDEAVSFQFVADGGTGGGSLTYSVQSGSLPTGTSLDSAGLLTGTPNTEETVTFSLRVTDQAGLFADRAFSVVVEVGLEALGGTITTDATYTYHTFTSSGTFSVDNSETTNFDVLLVAGGGGGGSGYSGGGGGAGGVLIKTGHSLSTGSYSVTVGSGGAGRSDFGGRKAGDNGQNSVFDLLTAFGGGGGGADSSGQEPKDGGSGGGHYGSDVSSYGQSTQTSNNGGIGYGNPGAAQGSQASPGGGGGGAGSAGSQGIQSVYGGDGGSGIQLLDWSSATATGDNGYYAGGGGGSGKDWQNGQNLPGGSGGSGGGGAGSFQAGTDGSANTGGGGGGAGDGGYTAGSGGSGIVIIRYPTP